MAAPSSPNPAEPSTSVASLAPAPAPPSLSSGPAAPTTTSVPNTSSAALATALAARHASLAARAARFGASQKEAEGHRAGEVAVLGARRAAVRSGFVTGFDVTGEKEQGKRIGRANRFGAGGEGNEKGEGDGVLGEAPVVSNGNALASAGALGSSNALATAGALGTSGFVGADKILENRRDVAIGETVRESVLHVFGVDDMSTKHIQALFGDYGPSWIEWINDSSCNVTFEDDFTAKRVLMFSCADAADEAPPDRMSDADGAGMSAAVAGEGVLGDGCVWKMMKGRGLWVRRATEKDVRPGRPNPRSKWARSLVGERAEARERGRVRARGRRAEEDEMRDLEIEIEAVRKKGRRRGGTRREGDQSKTLPVAMTRRLGVRGGIGKASARKPTMMDVDRPLDSKR